MNTEWTKSTYSHASGDCVECRADGDSAQLRDTQHPHHGHLAFPHREWAAFLAELHSL
ncbi:DUF397 domain-containing protein [Streptomonospora sp. PA3]|uniref:DUF397 domain-containing protein n=1 Tax=Streptomonospora sp. PA3 TaxID=2607326 RepID=UPI00130B6189|nr:DUF397 domain-containing protein [Streptomonospora sp. PA3]